MLYKDGIWRDGETDTDADDLPKFFLLNRDYKYENNILILKEIKRSYF